MDHPNHKAVGAVERTAHTHLPTRGRPAAQQLVHAFAVAVQGRKVEARVVAALIREQWVRAIGHQVLHAVGVPAQCACVFMEAVSLSSDEAVVRRCLLQLGQVRSADERGCTRVITRN